MRISTLSPSALEAITRVRQSMPEGQLAIADRMAVVNAGHIPTHRDKEFADRLEHMKRSLVAHYSGDDKQYRMLLVIGKSHSGKSSLIEHALSTDPAFDTYTASDGVEATPCLFLEAPSPATLRNLAVEGLEKLGYPVKSDITESRAWPLFRQQLKRRRVLFVFIDEAQHIINTNNQPECQKVRDTLKHLVQMKDWPVRLIMSGVPPLEALRNQDEQIEERSMVLNLGPLNATKHAPHVRKYVKLVVVEHAAMHLEDFLDGDFPERVIYACDGCFGSIVKIIRAAVEVAMVECCASVGKRHFEKAYGQITGCSTTSNIFTGNEWRTAAAGVAKVTLETPAADKPKALRAGERRK
jgi:hypothetical protein